jgi:predicted Zn-dependent protease
MASRLRLLLLCLPLVALGACSLNPATGERSFTAFMSREDEMKVGWKEHPKVLGAFGGAYVDRDLATYVESVGRRLAAVSEIKELPYTFTVLNDETVNAFALPGGYVYVTRGLLALVDDEAQLAAVIAHEIGHITGRHTAQRYSKAMATNLGINVLGVVAGLFGAPPGISTLASMGADLYLKGYSREQEMEADLLGVRYLARAGYHTGAMTGFFHKLSAFKQLEAALVGDPEAAERFNLTSTHPRTAERIEQAVRLANVAPVAAPRSGRADYLTHIDGLVFGDDPFRGVRKGRHFVHPGLGIRFTLPPGFYMVNDKRRVIGRGSAGSLIVFDMEDSRKAARAGDLAKYIAKDFGAGMSIREVEPITVNDMPGVTGRGIHKIKEKTYDVRLVVVREGLERLYRFIFLTPPSLTARLATEMRRTTYSFRRLSATEASSVRPLRLRVVRARPGDTPYSLAARMPMEAANLEWFAVLNGMRPDHSLAPGTLVKIVAE